MEVRLDRDCRKRLDELAEIVRQVMAGSNDQVLRERRRQAAEELIAMKAEVPPDPEELARLLGTAHDTCGIR